MKDMERVPSLCRALIVSLIFLLHKSVEVVRAVRADELFRCIKREYNFFLKDQGSIQISDPHFFSRSIHGS